MIRRVLCRIGYHRPLGFVSFVWGSFAICESCQKRMPR